jgi:hypothetical protein
MEAPIEDSGWGSIILSITDAANTHNPALVVLRDKGYHLYFVPDERPNQFGVYIAIRERRVFSSGDPVALLGLVALWEHYGDNWHKNRPSEDLLEEVQRVGFADDDFGSLDHLAFERLVKHYRPLFAFFDRPIPEGITPVEFAISVKALSHEPDVRDEEEEPR